MVTRGVCFRSTTLGPPHTAHQHVRCRTQHRRDERRCHAPNAVAPTNNSAAEPPHLSVLVLPEMAVQVVHGQQRVHVVPASLCKSRGQLKALRHAAAGAARERDSSRCVPGGVDSLRAGGLAHHRHLTPPLSMACRGRAVMVLRFVVWHSKGARAKQRRPVRTTGPHTPAHAHTARCSSAATALGLHAIQHSKASQA